MLPPKPKGKDPYVASNAPLPWLRAFESSARHLSFTNAVSELNLTQAAISKQVKLLEHYLKEPLFERLARSLALTKVGAAYLPKVQDAFERLSEGTLELFGGRNSEKLSVRAPISFAVKWLAARLPNFLAAHPKTNVRIISSVWAEDFEAERYDLDIRYGFGRWPGFKTDRLTWEVLEPLCLPEIAARLHTPNDLAKERLLHVLGYQEGWASWLKAAGATGVNAGSGLHLDTSLMAFEVAANGGGVALGRRSMSGTELTSGRLVRPFDPALPIDECFYLVAPEKGPMHPGTELFRAWLLAEATETPA